MSELLLSKLRDESVQARNKMYYILSALRRRGVDNLKVIFGPKLTGFAYVQDEAAYKYAREIGVDVYPLFGLYCFDTETVGVKKIYNISFIGGSTFIYTDDTVLEFDISELLFELKFEGME